MRDTVNTTVITFLEEAGCGIFGVDLFFGRVPEKNIEGKPTPTDCWWVIPLSTSVTHHNVTGEDSIRYPYTLYRRSRELKKVDQGIQKATNAILDSKCHNFGDYKTLALDLVGTNQQYGEDTEERAYASLAFAATLYDITNPAELKPEDQSS